MHAMLAALESVLTVLLMMAIGFLLARRGWFDQAARGLVSRLVVSVALPCYMVANLMGGYDRARLLAMLPGLPIPFLVMGACFGLAWALSALFRLPPGRRGAFASMFSLSNTIFIGLPVNTLLFGEASLPYVLLYYIANTTLFWTVGVWGIARDGSVAGGRAAPPFLSRESLGRILSPPLLGFLAAVALIMLGVTLPKPLMDLCKTMGAMTTPLSMLFIGIVVAEADWRGLRPDAGVILAVAGRFIVSPLILIGIVRLARPLDLPLLLKSVFLIQAAMPAMTQTPILARAYEADTEYAGIVTSLTTALSLATIPLFMSLARLVF
jgi:malate permease and related proteins